MILRTKKNTVVFGTETPRPKLSKAQKSKKKRANKGLATNPETPSDDLLNLWLEFPVEVCSNPNLSPSHIGRLSQKISTLVEFTESLRSHSKLKEKHYLRGLASFWALMENPAVALIELEDPASPVVNVTRERYRRLQFDYLLSTLTPQELGAAYCHIMGGFLCHPKNLNPGFYRSWLYMLSSIWLTINGQPIPAHYAVGKTIQIQRSTNDRCNLLLETMAHSLKNARNHDWKRAINQMMVCARLLAAPADGSKNAPGLEFLEEDIQLIIGSLEQASMGRTWPDFAATELLELQPKPRPREANESLLDFLSAGLQA